MDLGTRNIGYRWCIVPKCGNTTVNSPRKIFFNVPRNETDRMKWCEAMKRDQYRSNKLSPISTLFCCQDHFDVEKDTDNFMRYKLMFVEQGVPVILRLKKGIIPHKFHCQEDKNRIPSRDNTLNRPINMSEQHANDQEALETFRVKIEPVDIPEQFADESDMHDMKEYVKCEIDPFDQFCEVDRPSYIKIERSYPQDQSDSSVCEQS